VQCCHTAPLPGFDSAVAQAAAGEHDGLARAGFRLGLRHPERGTFAGVLYLFAVQELLSQVDLLFHVYESFRAVLPGCRRRERPVSNIAVPARLLGAAPR
jgi:hypothetical protein